MLAVHTNKLCKNYGSHLGIKDVSLEIEEGEIFGFIGPNGSGKSTTIRTLLGLLIPTSGSATIFGDDIIQKGHEIRRNIGYLPAEVNYYEEMSSKELLEYHCRYYGIKDYAEIQTLAQLFELDLNKKITELSFGNIKKCGIIQSLLHHPKLLIMDEPTSGLDPLMQNIFFDLLKQKNEKGTTIFFSSHILSEVQNFCHRTAIIKQGEIIATENIQTLLEKQMKKVHIFFKEKPSNFVLPVGVQNQNWNGNNLNFEYLGSMDDLIKYLSNYELRDLVIQEPELESIVMNYY